MELLKVTSCDGLLKLTKSLMFTWGGSYVNAEEHKMMAILVAMNIWTGTVSLKPSNHSATLVNWSVFSSLLTAHRGGQEPHSRIQSSSTNIV